LNDDKTVKFDIIDGSAIAKAKYEKVLNEKFVKVERPNKVCAANDSGSVKRCDEYTDTVM